jgi:hypothetical protein
MAGFDGEHASFIRESSAAALLFAKFRNFALHSAASATIAAGQ